MIEDLLAAYDSQLRAHVPERLPAGATVERDGPLTRSIGFGHRGFVEYHALGDLDEAELDALIARQVERFRELGLPFEWKQHGHDGPAFLVERLLAAGFAPEEQETVLVAAIAELDLAVEPPAGVTLREVRERPDLERIAELEGEVWGASQTFRAADLERELAADPAALRVFAAEAGGAVVCAGWLRFPSATEFATLWGGSTLERWRRRGIYRALVSARARVALEGGRRYLEVDAAPASRPILERLGFRVLTSTTPYVWRPPRPSP
ncbi:MAG TPA: GNAT family N-acetyltransferase [Gaiellaceae bacterium]|nr:GNAT family N-acetyltransferase [Gaiellaceae bacterium]